MEPVVEGYVKKSHHLSALVQIVCKRPQVILPILPDGRKGPAGLPAEFLQPVGEKGKADVFDRIQPETVYAGRLQIPFAPAVQLLNDLGCAHIQVRPHQIVIVAVFAVHLMIPFLALDLVDCRGAVFAVPVHAVKTGPVPLKV